MYPWLAIFVAKVLCVNWFWFCSMTTAMGSRTTYSILPFPSREQPVLMVTEVHFMEGNKHRGHMC